MGTSWLTTEDKKRIRDYLAKPSHERRIDDLVPGEGESADRQ